MNSHAFSLRTTPIIGSLVMVFLITVLLIFGVGSNAQAGTISQTPLFLASTAIEPNIMLIIDDSGSMDASYLPDSICTTTNLQTTKRAKSSIVNKLYYNPAITYQPPLKADGSSFSNSSFTAALKDGYGVVTGTVNLSTSYKPSWNPGSTGCTNGTPEASTAEAAYYYVYSPPRANCDNTINDDDCYVKTVVTATSGPGGTDERTNFANWYSYYRTRLYTAKAAISRSFGQQGSNMRVGYGQISDSTSNSIDGKSVTTITRGVRPFLDTDRAAFFTWLFGLEGSTYTPLRRALDAAGQYYENTAINGPWSLTPNSTGANGGAVQSCRQSYTIMTTDGYWNDAQAATAGARADNDGTAGSTITGPNGESFTYSPVSPFKDSPLNTYVNTLADVAMYYWKRDLLPTVDNRVPISNRDPAFWQHMVTFGIGLGVPTQNDPDTAFNAITTGASITWPDPIVTDTDAASPPAARIDDLLHASVNGHGRFFNAQSPEEFTDQLQTTLEDIIARKESSVASLATNSTKLSTGTTSYRATFNSDGWSGQLVATLLNSDGTLGAEQWNTDTTGKIPAYSSRKIYTIVDGVGKEFLWANLNASQKTALNTLNTVVSSDTVGQQRLNWIRGNQSDEKPTGTLRKRTKLLGDIVNSDPFYVESGSTKTLYVGANDGMLHAFNAETGVELFAYIPKAVFSNLSSLPDPNYGHKYFVDGSPIVTKLDDGRLILVGTTGAGGRSIFALDVTNPGSFNPTTDVLWEITNTDVLGGITNTDMGYIIGQPSIGRLKNGDWAVVFGNGYNSDGGKAFIFVVKLADTNKGTLIAKASTLVGDTTTPNGLAKPTLLADTNGRVVAAYAGDMRGNLWKYDLNTYQFAFGNTTPRTPLFTAKNASNVAQPITSGPEIGRHPNGGYLIFFGTGKYFEVGDHTATGIPVQSLYGIWDTATLVNDVWSGGAAITVTDRSVLLQQQITSESTVAGNKWRIVSNNPITWGSIANPEKRGWYVDLAVNNTAAGERVTDSPILNGGRAIFITRIPFNSTDPCIPSVGTSWLMAVDMLTGGRSNTIVFDVNRDNQFDQLDTILVNGQRVAVSGFETIAAGMSRATLIQFSKGSIDVLLSGTTKLTTTASATKASSEAAAQAVAAAATTAQAAITAAQAAAGADVAVNKAAAQAIVEAANAIITAADAIITAGSGVVDVGTATAIKTEAQAIKNLAQPIVSTGVPIPNDLSPRIEALRAQLQGEGNVGVRIAGELSALPQKTWHQLR